MPARQGEEWEYSDQDSYVLASVVLRFNLFNGGGDRAAIRAARVPSAELAAGRALAEQQIRIEVQEAITDLEVAEASLATARAASRPPKPPTRSSRRSATSARCRRPITSIRSAR